MVNGSALATESTTTSPDGGPWPGCVVLVVGPTAGHVYPALALADEFRRQRPACRIRFVGPAGGPAARILDKAGERLEVIGGSPVRRAGIAGGAAALVRAIAGFGAARRRLARDRADLVVGFGSYVSGSVVLAAASLGRATAIHEANARPGLANRWLTRAADRIFIGFEAAAPYFPAARTSLTGTPIRQSILVDDRRETPLSPPRLLVVAGSEGEGFLARAGPALAAALVRRHTAVGVLHQSATLDPAAIGRAYRDAGIDATVVAFIADMGAAYQATDVVVTRGGGSTLAELAAAGRPAVVVPLAGSADDHQGANASAFAAAGAALAIGEDDWSADRAADWIAGVVGDPVRWRASVARARALARPDAARVIVDACLARSR